MKSPNLLKSNLRKIKESLKDILDENCVQAIENELQSHVVALFELGISHYKFASKVKPVDWRQKISRFYYAVYNVRRSIVLMESGKYSTDSKEHQKTDDLPPDFPNREKYKNEIKTLRDDRNLCDYDHVVRKTDLFFSLVDAQDLVREFIRDARVYLKNRRLSLG